MDDSLGGFNLILLALPGMAMIVVARTLFPHRPGRRPEMQQQMRSIGVLLLLIALSGAATAIVGYLALLLIPTIVIVILMIVDRYRRGEHQALLYTLAAGIRRGVPLPVSARAFADENGGDTSTRASVLAENIERGLPLREAVRRARLKTSTASKLAVRLGESLGDLGNVLFRSLDDVTEIDAALRGAAAQMFYLLALVVIGSNILIFIMLKIVPIFQRMFEEFGLKLPSLTVLLINLSNALVAWIPIGIVPFVIVSMVALFLGTLYFVGWLPADTPGIRWLARRYDQSLVLRGLALCVRRGLSLGDAMQVMSQEFPRSNTAWRLRLAWYGIGCGVPWRLSMQRAGLLSDAESAVLGAAERSGNLPWALEEMADSSLRRYILRLQMRYQTAFPLVLLLLGGVVGFVVIALFMPLVALIQGLS